MKSSFLPDREHYLAPLLVKAEEETSSSSFWGERAVAPAYLLGAGLCGLVTIPLYLLRSACIGLLSLTSKKEARLYRSIAVSDLKHCAQSVIFSAMSVFLVVASFFFGKRVFDLVSPVKKGEEGRPVGPMSVGEKIRVFKTRTKIEERMEKAMKLQDLPHRDKVKAIKNEIEADPEGQYLRLSVEEGKDKLELQWNLADRKEAKQVAQFIDRWMTYLEKSNHPKDAKGVLGSFRNFYSRWFKEHDHISKQEKYHHFLGEMVNGLAREKVDLDAEIKDLSSAVSQNPKEKWLKDAHKALVYLSCTAGDMRKAAHLHIEHLRKAITSKEYQAIPNDPAHPFFRLKEVLQLICYVRFAEINLTQYSEELVELAAGPIDTTLTLENFYTVFDEKDAKLSKVAPLYGKPEFDKTAQKLSGHFNVKFDPTAQHNVPYLRHVEKFSGEEMGEREVRLLRHGTPTMESGATSMFKNPIGTLFNKVTGKEAIFHHAKIVPEYELYVQEAAKRKEKIFHAVLEKKKPRFNGNEADRHYAKHELAKKYPETYFVVSLPLDGNFFDRKGKFAQVQTFDELKKHLSEQILDTNSDFQVSANLNLAKLEIAKLIEETHEIFFDNKEKIESREEYRAFLMLFYTHLQHKVTIGEEISMVKTICKDCIDRGNMMLTIRELYYLIMLGEEENTQKLEQIFKQALAAPFHVKKQGVVPHRKILLKEVLDILVKMTPEQKAKLRGYRVGDVKIDSMEFPKRANQPVIPLISPHLPFVKAPLIKKA